MSSGTLPVIMSFVILLTTDCRGGPLEVVVRKVCAPKSSRIQVCIPVVISYHMIAKPSFRGTVSEASGVKVHTTEQSHFSKLMVGQEAQTQASHILIQSMMRVTNRVVKEDFRTRTSRLQIL